MNAVTANSAMCIGALLALRGVSTPIMSASVTVRLAVARLLKTDRGAALVFREDDRFCGVLCEASLIAAFASHSDAALIKQLAMSRQIEMWRFVRSTTRWAMLLDAWSRTEETFSS